ncbi:MAG: kelch repeat-containing protein, partial [bacterium]
WVWDPGVVPGTIVVSQSSDYFFFRIRNDQWLGDLLALDEVNQHLFIPEGSLVYVYDASTLDLPLVQTIGPGSGKVQGMVLDATNRRIIVAEDVFGSIGLRFIDLTTFVESPQFYSVGGQFKSMSVDEERGLLYLNSFLSTNKTTVFRLDTLANPIEYVSDFTLGPMSFVPGINQAYARTGFLSGRQRLAQLDVSGNPVVVDEIPLISELALVYNPNTNRLVSLDVARHVLMQLDVPTAPASWHGVATAGQTPFPIHSFGMVGRNSDVVLFGGRQGDNTLSNETWRLNGTTWTRLFPFVNPSSREGHAMALFNEIVDGALLFGGYDGLNFLGDTWIYTDLNGWAQQFQTPPPQPPTPRAYAQIAFDSLRGQHILFGGKDGATTFGDTWVYLGGQWVELSPLTPPSPRHSHMMAYMKSIDRIVLFGGVDSTGKVLRDTWLFNGSFASWTPVNTSTAPLARYGVSMTYDEKLDRVVLFGGLGGINQPLGDTWEFDGREWYQVPTGAAPSPRAGHQVVYDQTQGKTLIFGGASGIGRVVEAPGTSGVSNDLFELSVVPPRLDRAVFFKANTSTTDAGTSDRIQLTFNQDMFVRERIPAQSPFYLPVLGDGLGTAFAMKESPLNRRQIDVSLGQGPVLTRDGVFAFDSTSAGSPSGIDVAPVAALSPPLVSRLGVAPIDSGLPGVNDSAFDISRTCKPVSRVFAPGEGGTVASPSEAGLTYTKHRVRIEPGSLPPDVGWECTMQPPPENLGVGNALSVLFTDSSGGAALQQSGSAINFSKPVSITVEYQDSDFDPSAGQNETMLRVHHLVETSTGTLQFVPIEDVTGAQEVNPTSKTVTVRINKLGGLVSSSPLATHQTAVETFANIALDIVNENSANIAPSPGASVKLSAGSVSLVPGPFGAYTKHTIVIPNYATASSGTGTRITIRSAATSERGGFPSQSNALFTITTQNAQTSANVSFTDPVNVTVQYIPSTDLVDLNGSAVTEDKMKMAARNPNSGAFEFPGGDTVNTTNDTVTLSNVTNLTTDGVGTWGATGMPVSAVTFGFDTDSEGWSFITIPLPDFSAPTSAATGGMVSLHSTTNTNTFGFWQSPSGAFPVVSDRLYRAIFRVKTDVTTPSMVPGIRPRLNNLNGQTSAFISVDSNGAATDVTTPAGKDYEVYFLPFQGGAQGSSGEMTASFDLINFSTSDQADATMSLDQLTVDSEAMDTVNASFTPVTNYTFDAGSQGWSFISLPGVFGDVTSSSSGGVLGMTATTNVNAFGFWMSPVLTVSDNTLYRFRYAMRTSVATQSQVPGIRLRANTLSGESAAAVRVDSGGNGASSPIVGSNTFYDLYLRPGPSGVTSGVNTSADLINFNTADTLNGDLIIDAVSVDKATLPLF